jgi:hypothetical protein
MKLQFGVAPTEVRCLARVATKGYSLGLCRLIDRSPTEV